MQQPRLPTRPETDAFLAPCLALLAWLFSAVTGASRAELRRSVAYAERAVQSLIFLWAVARVAPPCARAAYNIAFNAPPGFRRGRVSRRLFFRHAGIAKRGAGYIARIGRLVSALANPERYIARFVALILRGRRAASLVATAPPASAWRNAAARAATSLNSS